MSNVRPIVFLLQLLLCESTPLHRNVGTHQLSFIYLSASNNWLYISPHSLTQVINGLGTYPFSSISCSVPGLYALSLRVAMFAHFCPFCGVVLPLSCLAILSETWSTSTKPVLDQATLKTQAGGPSASSLTS